MAINFRNLVVGLLAFGCAITLVLTANTNADWAKAVARDDGLAQQAPAPIQPATTRKSVKASQAQPIAVGADFVAHSDNAKPKLISGLFRGDWGPTPVYAKNDRVNFERGAYLSLVDNNQNQPPSTSQGYWQLVKKFKALHEENCFAPAPGLDMGECDFTAAGSLKDLNLQGATLTKARLNGELGAADLTGANLSGAAVLGTLVIGPDTIMTHANLSYLQSDGNNPLIAEHANLASTNFTQANLYGAKLSHADLTSAHMPEAVLTGSQLASANFADANLTKVDLAYANLTDSSLIHAAMPQANLEQADLHGADFSQANLQQANLAGTQVAGVNFSGADLHGVNLSAAQGADSAIIDNQTNFTGAICPDGVTVDGVVATTCVGHGF